MFNQSNLKKVLHAIFTLLLCTAVQGRILLKGSSLVGGVNGINFDKNNTLTVAQVYGRAISKVNIDTGHIIETLTFQYPSNLIVFPDDLIFDSEGKMYYTDPQYFQTVLVKGVDQPTVPLLPPLSIPFVNSISLSTDQSKLFYAQCWNINDGNSLFQLDLNTFEVEIIVKDIFGCASNAMSYKDEALYTPRPFEGRVVKVDLSVRPAVISNVTTSMVSPNAVKFDSKGNLHVLDTGSGEVVVVDREEENTDKNRIILAKFPMNSLDNLAFDANDRLFVSSTSDASITEILFHGGKQSVVDAGISIPMGLALVKETQKIYTLSPGALYEIDPKSGNYNTIDRSAVSLGPMNEPTNVVAWSDKLVLLSAITNSLMIWNLSLAQAEAIIPHESPIDAHPFRNDLLVTSLASGSIERIHIKSTLNVTKESIASGAYSRYTFLAGDDNDVYATNIGNGSIVQVISGGVVLEQPRVIVTGLIIPEGIALYGKELLAIDSGDQKLYAINLVTGEKRIVAKDLGFLDGIDELPFGYPNKAIVLDNGSICVNADKSNVIHLLHDDHSPKRKSTKSGKVAKGERSKKNSEEWEYNLRHVD